MKKYKINSLKIKLNIFFILSSLIFSSSCSIDDNLDPAKDIYREIYKDIDTATFWNNATQYVIKKSDFTINDTLIIQAGTIIKFDPDSNCSFIIAEKGYVSAQGIESNPIIFTSYNDNLQINNSKNSSKQPSVGDWNKIILNGQLKSYFNYCKFCYGGGNQQYSTMQFGSEVAASITNCTFTYNDGGNIETGFGVIDATQASPNSLIRFNIFYSNNLPICISTLISIDSTNIFHNPTNISLKNKYNTIKVNTSLPLNSYTKWLEDEVAYVICGPTFTISSNGALIVGDNVTLKFTYKTRMILEGANTTLLNNDGPGVIFTSIYDDEHKGDTNGDGNSTYPEKGNWSLSVTDSSSFDWNNILYAN